MRDGDAGAIGRAVVGVCVAVDAADGRIVGWAEAGCEAKKGCVSVE